MQTARPLPASVPLCCHGHRPQIVTTTGAPLGHRLGAPCPVLFHIECHSCGQATVPAKDMAMAESRWTHPDSAAYRIPISHLRRARADVLAQIVADADLAIARATPMRDLRGPASIQPARGY